MWVQWEEAWGVEVDSDEQEGFKDKIEDLKTRSGYSGRSLGLHVGNSFREIGCLGGEPSTGLRCY